MLSPAPVGCKCVVVGWLLCHIATLPHCHHRASLTPKKSTELSWNIYILEKKDTAAMYQEFVSISVPPIHHPSNSPSLPCLPSPSSPAPSMSCPALSTTAPLQCITTCSVRAITSCAVRYCSNQTLLPQSWSVHCVITVW